MDIIELGNSFRTARIEHRLTQADVALRTGLSVATVARLERGELLELGVVKLLNLFNVVGLELYPRPLGHQRTLDDIQRERINSATSLGLRAAIAARNDAAHPDPGASGLRAAGRARSLKLKPDQIQSARGLRTGQEILIQKSIAHQRVRHSKVEKTRG